MEPREHKIQNRLINPQFWIYSAICLIHSISVITWAVYTQALPDVDAITQVLNPLELGVEMVRDQWSFLEIQAALPVGNYPPVANLLSFLLVNTNLDWLLRLEFYNLSLLFLLPFYLLWPRITGSLKRACWTLPVFLFFPITILCTRALSWHSFIIFYSLLAVLLYVKWLREDKSADLILAILLMTLSVGIKHLGVIHFGLFFLALFFANNPKTMTKPFLVAIPLFFGGALYLCNGGLVQYLLETLDHNPLLKHFLVLFVISGVPLLILVKKVFRSFYPIFSKTRDNTGKTCLLINSFSLLCYPIFSIFDEYSQLAATLTVPGLLVLTMTPLMVYQGSNLERSSEDRIINVYLGLLVLTGSFLFFSSLGYLHAIFQLACLLSLCLWLIKTPYKWWYSILLLLFLFLGNFFPGKPSLHENDSYFEAQLAFLFNGTTHNYWNWNKQSYLALRKRVQELNSNISHQEEDSLLCLAPGLDQYQDPALRVSSRVFESMVTLQCEAGIPTVELYPLLSLKAEELATQVAIIVVDESRVNQQNKPPALEAAERHLEPSKKEDLAQFLASRVLNQNQSFQLLDKVPEPYLIFVNRGLVFQSKEEQEALILVNNFEAISSLKRKHYWEKFVTSSLSNELKLDLVSKGLLRLLQTDFSHSFQEYINRLTGSFPVDRNLMETLRLIKTHHRFYSAVSSTFNYSSDPPKFVKNDTSDWEQLVFRVKESIQSKLQVELAQLSTEDYEFWITMRDLMALRGEKAFTTKLKNDAINFIKLFLTMPNSSEENYSLQVFADLGLSNQLQCAKQLQSNLQGPLSDQIINQLPLLSTNFNLNNIQGQCNDLEEWKELIKSRIQEVLENTDYLSPSSISGWKMFSELSTPKELEVYVKLPIYQLASQWLQAETTQKLNRLFIEYSWLNNNFELYSFANELKSDNHEYIFPGFEPGKSNEALRYLEDSFAEKIYNLGSAKIEHDLELACYYFLLALYVSPQHQNSLADLGILCSLLQELPPDSRLLTKLKNQSLNRSRFPENLRACLIKALEESQ